jgi:hypothetical protein
MGKAAGSCGSGHHERIDLSWGAHALKGAGAVWLLQGLALAPFADAGNPAETCQTAEGVDLTQQSGKESQVEGLGGQKQG